MSTMLFTWLFPRWAAGVVKVCEGMSIWCQRHLADLDSGIEHQAGSFAKSQDAGQSCWSTDTWKSPIPRSHSCHRCPTPFGSASCLVARFQVVLTKFRDFW